MTTTIKATTAGDFLALVPSMLGYNPSNSILIVPFASNRSMGVMRVDLPCDEDEDGVAKQLVHLASRIDGTDYMCIIIYTDKPAGDVVSLLALIGEYAEIGGLEVRDLLIVASDGYCSMNEDGMPLRPTSELAVHLDAPVPAPNILAGTELPVIADDILMDVAAAIPRFEVEDYNLNEWAEGAIVIGQPDRLAVSDLVMAIVVFSRPSYRDIFIVQAVSGREMGEFATAAQIAWEHGAEYPSSIASALWGDGEQPNPKRLEAGLELARWAAALTGEAGALASAGWFSWALGRSTHAEHYAKLAKEADPSHGLAEILLSFVNAGHLPAWAFKRRG